MNYIEIHNKTIQDIEARFYATKEEFNNILSIAVDKMIKAGVINRRTSFESVMYAHYNKTTVYIGWYNLSEDRESYPTSQVDLDVFNSFMEQAISENNFAVRYNVNEVSIENIEKHIHYVKSRNLIDSGILLSLYRSVLESLINDGFAHRTPDLFIGFALDGDKVSIKWVNSATNEPTHTDCWVDTAVFNLYLKREFQRMGINNNVIVGGF